jgi:signal transduction histidine kinase
MAVKPPDTEPLLPHLNDLSSSSMSWSMVSKLTKTKLTLGLWSIAAVLDLSIAFAGPATAATVVRVAVTYSCGFGLSLAAFHFLARGVTGVAGFSFIRILGIAIPSGTALFLIDVFGRVVAHGHPPFHPWPTDFFLRLRHNWAYFTMLFVFQSTITWLTASAQALARRERQLLEARLSALRLQLNPHFLFNTLNAILALVSEAGAVQAEEMILRLSSFLRASLADEPTVLVPLAAEIDMVQAYLEIEAVRFGDRLKIRYQCDADLDDAQVPNFILQPLIENAVKYAVAVSREPVTVSVEATLAGGDLILSVKDDGRMSAGGEGSGLGVGLRNVAARLEALYGAAGSVAANRREVGFTAVVRLPLSRAS